MAVGRVLFYHALILTNPAYWTQSIGWVMAILLVSGAVSARMVPTRQDDRDRPAISLRGRMMRSICMATSPANTELRLSRPAGPELLEKPVGCFRHPATNIQRNL